MWSQRSRYCHKLTERLWNFYFSRDGLDSLCSLCNTLKQTLTKTSLLFQRRKYGILESNPSKTKKSLFSLQLQTQTQYIHKDLKACAVSVNSHKGQCFTASALFICPCAFVCMSATRWKSVVYCFPGGPAEPYRQSNVLQIGQCCWVMQSVPCMVTV